MSEKFINRAQRIMKAADKVANILDGAKRLGAPTDRPEGVRLITISDTMARKMSGWLREGLEGTRPTDEDL